MGDLQAVCQAGKTNTARFVNVDHVRDAVQHACLIMNGNFLKGYLHSGHNRADFKTV